MYCYGTSMVSNICTALLLFPRKVSVFPLESVKGQAAATATHTTEAKADVGSRKERRRATYKPRGSSSAEPVATVAVVAASTQP